MNVSAPRPHGRPRWLWRVAAVLALALVFVSYLRPDMMFELANRVWSCF
jgi:hypothetical protein